MRLVIKNSKAKTRKSTDHDNTPPSPPPHHPPSHQSPYEPRKLEFRLRPPNNPQLPILPPGPSNLVQLMTDNIKPLQTISGGEDLSLGEINKAISNPREFEKLIKEQEQCLAAYNKPNQELAPSKDDDEVTGMLKRAEQHAGPLPQQQPTSVEPQPVRLQEKPKVRPRWTGLGPDVPCGQPMGPPPSRLPGQYGRPMSMPGEADFSVDEINRAIDNLQKYPLIDSMEHARQPKGPQSQQRPVSDGPKLHPRWTGLGPLVPRGKPMGLPPSLQSRQENEQHVSLSPRTGSGIRAEPKQAPLSPPLRTGTSPQALPLKKRPIMGRLEWQGNDWQFSDGSNSDD